MDDLIRLDRVSFKHKQAAKPSLADVTFGVPPGTIVAVLGPGGGGKSSICHAVTGVIPHLLLGEYSGTVTVSDVEVAQSTVSTLSEAVAYVSQDFDSQLFCSTVESEVAFALENLGVVHTEMRQRVERHLIRADLGPIRFANPDGLSGGQRQRLVVAAALAMEARSLVMDEPSTDLDIGAHAYVLEALAHVKSTGGGVLVTDHRTETAAKSDIVCVVAGGRIRSIGESSRLLADVRLLEACSIRPPTTVELLSRLGIECELVPSVEETVSRLERRFGPFRPDRISTTLPFGGVPALEGTDIVFSYPDARTRALDAASLRIPAGQLAAVVGSNGSGKSTLLKQFVGLLQPQGGEILIDGQAVKDYTRQELARRVGYVFQNPDRQIFAPTVFEEVSYSLRNFGLNAATTATRVEEVLELLDLAGRDNDDPARLTKGERQRIAVASALATQPGILLLDEPTKGLDYAAQCRLMRLLTRLCHSGHTVVLATHALWLVAEFCSYVALMSSGRVVGQGAAPMVIGNDDLLSKFGLSTPDSASIAAKLGAPTISVSGLADWLSGLPCKLSR